MRLRLSITLALAAATGLLLIAPLPLIAAPSDVLVIDGKSAGRQKAPKEDKNTKVINIKGTAVKRKAQALKDDICRKVKDYYCRDIGKTAMHKVTELELGTVIGVAWKSKGDVIGALWSPPKPMGVAIVSDDELDTALEGQAIEYGDELVYVKITEPVKPVLKNTLAKEGAFYYIIYSREYPVPVYIECHKASVQ